MEIFNVTKEAANQNEQNCVGCVVLWKSTNLNRRGQINVDLFFITILQF